MSISEPKPITVDFRINTKTAPSAFNEAASWAQISFEYEGTKFRKSAFGIHARVEWDYTDFGKAKLPSALKKLAITSMELRWNGEVPKKGKAGIKPPELKVKSKESYSYITHVLATAEVSERPTCHVVRITVIGDKSFGSVKKAFIKMLNGQKM